MAITAKTSHKLHQTLGDEAGEDVVNWMQQVDSNRIELRELNDLNYARLDARFDAFEARMDARLAASEARNDARFSALDLTLERRFAASDLKLERRFSDLLKWSFVFWAGSLGALVALTKVFR